MQLTLNTINDYISSLNLEHNQHYLTFLKKCQAALSKSVLRELMENFVRKELSINDFFDANNKIITPEKGFNDIGMTEMMAMLKTDTDSYQSKYNAIKEKMEALIDKYSNLLGHDCELHYLFAKKFDEELEEGQNLTVYNTEYFKLLNARLDSIRIDINEDVNRLENDRFWSYSEVSNLFALFLLNEEMIEKKLSSDVSFVKNTVYYEISTVDPDVPYVIGQIYYRRVDITNNTGKITTTYRPTSFYSQSTNRTMYHFTVTKDTERDLNKEYYTDVLIQNDGVFNEISLVNDASRKEIVAKVKRHNELSNLLTTTIFSPLDRNQEDVFRIGKSFHNTDNYTFFLNFVSAVFPDTLVNFPDVKKVYYNLHNMNRLHVFSDAIDFLINMIIKHDLIDFSEGVTETVVSIAINKAIKKWFELAEEYYPLLSKSRVYEKIDHTIKWSWKSYEGTDTDPDNIRVKFDKEAEYFLKFLSARDSHLVTDSIKTEKDGSLNLDYYTGALINKELPMDAINFYSGTPGDFFDFMAFYMAVGYYIPMVIHEGVITDADISGIVTRTVNEYERVKEQLNKLKEDVTEKIDIQRELIHPEYKFIVDARRYE